MIDPKVVEGLVAENARSEESPLSELTPGSATCCARWRRGRTTRRSPTALFLTERSVEKVIHSIFLKLGLTWEPAVHKRVKAVILYLAESALASSRQRERARRRGSRRRAPTDVSRPPSASTRSRSRDRRQSATDEPAGLTTSKTSAPLLVAHVTVARVPAPARSNTSRQQR